MRLARAATLLAGAAAAYGVRAWRRDREGREIWADATDDLPDGPDTAGLSAAPAERGTEDPA